jgi:RNA-directed DNA polymerase
MVKVHYGEGLANHTDPESCAAYREVGGETFTGAHAGQPLSREIDLIQDADVVTFAEGKTSGCDIASTRAVLRTRSRDSQPPLCRSFQLT